MSAGSDANSKNTRNSRPEREASRGGGERGLVYEKTVSGHKLPRNIAHMNSVLRQLNHWRFRERLIRLAWGFGALVRHRRRRARCSRASPTGSSTATPARRRWRDIRKSTWLFAPSDPLSIGETPFWWFRVPLTAGATGARGRSRLSSCSCARGCGLHRSTTSPSNAERAFPAFDHRLVTAIQLNRPRADTRGMSKMLIGEVTREAGEIASRHNVLTLVDYRRLGWAVAVAAPVAARLGRVRRRQPGARDDSREAAGTARRRDPAHDPTGERHSRRLADRLRSRWFDSRSPATSARRWPACCASFRMTSPKSSTNSSTRRIRTPTEPTSRSSCRRCRGTSSSRPVSAPGAPNSRAR